MDTTPLDQIPGTMTPRSLDPEDKRPLAKDLTHHLSELSNGRSESPLKELFKHIHPGMLLFAGGIFMANYVDVQERRVLCISHWINFLQLMYLVQRPTSPLIDTSTPLCSSIDKDPIQR
jgi:hypothetical protein